ncbi:Methyl-CpG-binding domain protein 4-like protein [Zea mays]|uniref:Methyl-CpG-binding domain protein 4-like protein n=1 Tax=Zea mays TaxID=4577 RepID=A0A1D6LF33_MAIZE|nr:Methyl-CpG-binding domain protein 4-like protein [Zea mays]
MRAFSLFEFHYYASATYKQILRGVASHANMPLGCFMLG